MLELGVPPFPQEIEEPTEEPAPAEGSTEEPATTQEPTEELATLMATAREPAGEQDIPLCSMRREKREGSMQQLPWLDGGATSLLAGEPHWVEPSHSQQVEVAMPQLECRGKKGLALTS